MHYVYILSNVRRTVYYTGSTSDLKKRVYFHKRGLVPGFTREYNLDELVYYEVAKDIHSARGREKQIKSYRRGKKLALIRLMNPQIVDLGQQLV